MKARFPHRFALVFGLAVGFGALSSFGALAAEADPVLAKVNGSEIKLSAVEAYKKMLPPQIVSQLPQEQLLDSLIINQLIQEQAQKDGLEKDAEVQEALRQVSQQVIAKAWVSRKLKSQVTDAILKEKYAKLLADFKATDQEVRARHILTATENEAKAIIDEVKKGANFAELAKTKSTDPTAKSNGGDLGFFGKAEMVPEFSDVAFAMKVGDISAPVKSAFGWHVITVEARRDVAPPSFEEAEGPLREQMNEDAAEQLITDLRKGAKIELTTSEEKPVAPVEPKK